MKDQDLHLGPAIVKPFKYHRIKRSVGAVEGFLDVLVITMFILSCWLLYNAIVWSIWSQ